jgi:hypothetical protein
MNFIKVLIVFNAQFYRHNANIVKYFLVFLKYLLNPTQLFQNDS